ncbi:acyl-CoA thioesterase [Peribacillus sp. SCS-37]|uniref:acyl-CoA thioesterase n=1 Tax=Paraperibacillus esterisolvens TaxID=3115296 RepID=UPI003905A010
MYHTVIEPRVSETDGVGHINNTTIPVWLEAGRNPIFKLFMPDAGFRNWKMIIVNMNIDFKDQLFFGQSVEVYTWVKKIGNSSLILYEEIHQGGRICVTAEAAYVNYDMKSKRKERIPEGIRTELAHHSHI